MSFSAQRQAAIRTILRARATGDKHIIDDAEMAVFGHITDEELDKYIAEHFPDGLFDKSVTPLNAQATFAPEPVKRFHSSSIEHKREDLQAALKAALGDDADTQIAELVQRVGLDLNVQDALRKVLVQFGPEVFGAATLFSLEAQTSIMGDAEVMTSASASARLGLTIADLEWPADALDPVYADAAAPDDEEHRVRAERIRAGIGAWKAAHPEAD